MKKIKEKTKYIDPKIILEKFLKQVKIKFKKEVGFKEAEIQNIKDEGFRKFRFDYVLGNKILKLAIEFEGGTYVRGGGHHNRGVVMNDNFDKANLAQIRGWVILRYGAPHFYIPKTKGFQSKAKRQFEYTKKEILQAYSYAVDRAIKMGKDD